MIEAISLKVVGGAVIGAILGFGFYKLVGCPNGVCPLTSNPYTSTLYGMALGILATLP